jgi:disulfide bond formation protein DsbB
LQYGFGLEPCRLCLWQRWPYVAALALGLLGAAAPGWARWAVGLAGLAFLTGAGIAGFHAGVEYGWWEGLPGCAGEGLSGGVTMEDLQGALAGEDRVVPCDEPAFVFAGLSMAGWNFVLSLGLAAVSLAALARIGRA